MRDNSGKIFSFFILITIFLIAFSCKKNEIVRVSVLPEKLNSELHFRGFVTDEREELVSQIYNFSKIVTSIDSTGEQPVYSYISRGDKAYFYTDKNGTVWERTINDISAKLISYGFSYRDPIKLSRWEILLKQDEGVGTEWEASIDTTFDATTLKGEIQKIRYIKKGKARYDGWSQAFIPQLYENVDALDAYWYDLQTYYINQTTSDTLFATKGIAHQYFLPEIGSIKYITNFTKQEIDQPDVKLRGTWELMRKDIPE